MNAKIATLALVCAALAAGCGDNPPRETAAAKPIAPATQASAVPAHPRDIKYGKLEFEPPKRADYRAVLSNGLTVYLVPDRKIPAVRMEAFIDSGEVWVAKEKRGLAKLGGDLMRSGGIEGMDARALDKTLDALAAEIDVDFDLARGHATLWTLSSHLDESLGLFAKVLTKPVFAEDRIRRSKDEMKDGIEHRDDEPQSVLDHEVLKRIYGEASPIALRESAASVDAITREDLVAWHASELWPSETILAVSGDFDRAAMLKKLEAAFAGWNPGKPKRVRGAPGQPQAHPGVAVLDRELNQGFVEMVAPGIRMGDKDEVALQVMNYILGGGSFTSYITKAVRNDNGLAYSAGSYVHAQPKWPGVLGCYFQSKAESTAFAAKLCVDMLRKIESGPAAADELARAKDALLGRFPERFSTPHGLAGALAEDEFDGRPADWLSTYRAKVAAVTADDVMRVAKAHFVIDQLATVCVGPAAVIERPDEKNHAALAKLSADGKIEALKEEDAGPASPKPEAK